MSNESLWVEIKINMDISYLIGLFYSPQTASAIFFDSLHKNIEKALDTTKYNYSGRYERGFT